MKYVLDSNVALEWVLPESDSAKAIRVREEFFKPAEREECELLTADAKLVAILQGAFPFITFLASLR